MSLVALSLGSSFHIARNMGPNVWIYFIGRISFHGLAFATIVKIYDCIMELDMRATKRKQKKEPKRNYGQRRRETESEIQMNGKQRCGYLFLLPSKYSCDQWCAYRHILQHSHGRRHREREFKRTGDTTLKSESTNKVKKNIYKRHRTTVWVRESEWVSAAYNIRCYFYFFIIDYTIRFHLFPFVILSFDSVYCSIIFNLYKFRGKKRWKAASFAIKRSYTPTERNIWK